MFLKRKETALEKAVHSMSATFLPCEKMQFVSWKLKNILPRDGIQRHLDRPKNTDYSVLKHITNDGRKALVTFITEIIRKASISKHAVTIPTNVIVIIVKSGHICYGTNISLCD